MMLKQYHICAIYLTLFIALNCVMPHKAFGLNPWKQYKDRKEEEQLQRWREEEEQLQRWREMRLQEQERNRIIEKEKSNVRLAVDLMSLGSTCLLLKGGMANVCLGSAMVSIKLLSWVGADDNNILALKAWTSLLFSGAAFCFELRSMELCGGAILVFTHIMAL